MDYLDERHPRFVRGVHEAREVNPDRFDDITETLLSWAADAMGSDGIARCADAYATFTTEVNIRQGRYEARGEYEHRTYEDCYRDVYAQDSMADYLWGVYLTNFLWAHHMHLMCGYEQRFLKRLGEDARIAELAFGHGGWGLWALRYLPRATLVGYDISPSSIGIAQSLAGAAGFTDRVSYHEQDVLDLPVEIEQTADACICCFLIEHLEKPEKLYDAICRVLKPGGVAYMTGALTAAQADHIYEFRFESELVQMAELNGLRVLETHSSGPSRTLMNAQFLPRSMSLIMQRREHATW